MSASGPARGNTGIIPAPSEPPGVRRHADGHRAVSRRSRRACQRAAPAGSRRWRRFVPNRTTRVPTRDSMTSVLTSDPFREALW